MQGSYFRIPVSAVCFQITMNWSVRFELKKAMGTIVVNDGAGGWFRWVVTVTRWPSNAIP